MEFNDAKGVLAAEDHVVVEFIPGMGTFRGLSRKGIQYFDLSDVGEEAILDIGGIRGGRGTNYSPKCHGRNLRSGKMCNWAQIQTIYDEPNAVGDPQNET